MVKSVKFINLLFISQGRPDLTKKICPRVAREGGS